MRPVAGEPCRPVPYALTPVGGITRSLALCLCLQGMAITSAVAILVASMGLRVLELDWRVWGHLADRCCSAMHDAWYEVQPYASPPLLRHLRLDEVVPGALVSHAPAGPLCAALAW